MSSVVAASPEAVWAQIRTLDGVNEELGPWIRMTAPRHLRRVPFEQVPTGRVVHRSWLLVLGVIPLDLHGLCLEAVASGRGFRERSTSLLQSAWHHDRTLTPVDGGCRVEDRVAFLLRLPVSAVVAPVVRSLFRWRHRRLEARFGRLHPDASDDAAPGSPGR